MSDGERCGAARVTFIKAPPHRLLSRPFVGWQRLPVPFQEAVLPICSYMFWWCLCSVGCQERRRDNKWDWGQNEGCQSSAVLHELEKRRGPECGEKYCQLNWAGRKCRSHSDWIRRRTLPPYTNDSAHACCKVWDENKFIYNGPIIRSNMSNILVRLFFLLSQVEKGLLQNQI